MGKSGEAEYGVLYERSDYLGFGKRIGILFIDIIVYVLVAAILTVLTSVITMIAGIHPYDPLSSQIAWLVIIIAAFIYFPLLKATRIGTVGYRLFKARLVNLKGEKASLVKSTVRFMFVFIGPFNFLFDLIWLGGNKHRQTFRDLFVGTYVIRRDAEPVSRGRIIYPTYDVFSWNFTCSEVEDDRE